MPTVNVPAGARRFRTGGRPNTAHVRLSDAGMAVVDDMAMQEQRTRSDMIRILIAEAVKARATR